MAADRRAVRRAVVAAVNPSSQNAATCQTPRPPAAPGPFRERFGAAGNSCLAGTGAGDFGRRAYRGSYASDAAMRSLPGDKGGCPTARNSYQRGDAGRTSDRKATPGIRALCRLPNPPANGSWLRSAGPAHGRASVLADLIVLAGASVAGPSARDSGTVTVSSLINSAPGAAPMASGVPFAKHLHKLTGGNPSAFEVVSSSRRTRASSHTQSIGSPSLLSLRSH